MNGKYVNFKKKKEMDSSDSEKLRNQFNSDWRAQKTELVDQIGQLFLTDELTDVSFVFNHNESITVRILFLSFY